MVTWTNKLLAFLHDPPHKPVRIKGHEDQRASFLNAFGIAPDDIRQFECEADWQAAAADRLIFPDPAKAGLRVAWGETWLEFRHPLGGGALTPKSFPPAAAKLEEELPRALDAMKGADAQEWQSKFVAGALDEEIGEIMFTVGEREDGVVKTGTEQAKTFSTEAFFFARDLRIAQSLFEHGAPPSLPILAARRDGARKLFYDSPVEVPNPDPRGTADCGLRIADLIS